MFARGVGKVFQ